MKYFTAVASLILLVSSLGAEVSVFGAGDLKSDNPYGLTESEKVIYTNKKASLQNAKEIKALKIKVGQLSESLEGLRSVVESLSDKIGQTGQKIYEMDSRRSSADTQEIEVLKSELAAQKDQNEKIIKALKKLTAMIDEINANYVSKSELSQVKKKVNKRSSIQQPSRKEGVKSNATLLKEGIKAFREKKYSKANVIFERLDDKNYKRATSNYYLGEIAYYQKRYEEAIVYYKKSASLYDKASYMPTLLLHTALSFKKLGDTENARRFMEAIIESYPGSAQAKIAKKNL